MVDVGIITGSGVYELPVEHETRRVETRFGKAEVAVAEVGWWRIGAISRHGKGHRMLPHHVPYLANFAALKELGARAVLATTAVGALSAETPLGEPILFDDLYFPENRLPGGEPCTIFTEPGEPGRGHLIQSEPYSPHLRRKMRLAAEELGTGTTTGGTYGHVNGPRFNTEAELRTMRAAGVVAVSQTCGPETVLAGELGMPYCLAGFPVNYTPGAGSEEPEGEMDHLFSLAKEVLPPLILRSVERLVEGDFALDNSLLYRVEGGL